jgi:hypothetical protein
VQILTASIKGQKSVRLVNVYSQKVFNGEVKRPAESVSWDRIITGRGGHYHMQGFQCSQAALEPTLHGSKECRFSGKYH